eukprot:CAMPEP_0114250162 /NCGR_PEP_ID=MMETSP0058-20121206/14549_1 /TAXON_ID=36894 /ORGANISM="Pyramimonas parkeae, CCMP726" /LENGTH=94 /DNA_ID=CAMNT_0001363797 /DNA_START=306 /DNA_END=590 /DNA_ORIENTATION=-
MASAGVSERVTPANFQYPAITPRPKTPARDMVPPHPTEMWFGRGSEMLEGPMPPPTQTGQSEYMAQYDNKPPKTTAAARQIASVPPKHRTVRIR